MLFQHPLLNKHTHEHDTTRSIHGNTCGCGNAGAVGYIAPQVLNHDVKVKRQACCLLAQLAKHSLELAEVVVEADIFPKIYVCLKVADEWVRKHAATAIREVCTYVPICSSHRYAVMFLSFHHTWCQDGACKRTGRTLLHRPGSLFVHALPLQKHEKFP